MKKLSNLTIDDLRNVLTLLGLEYKRTKGGHELWAKPGMKRPVVFQTHLKPIPEFVVIKLIKTLGIDRNEFVKILETL